MSETRPPLRHADFAFTERMDGELALGGLPLSRLAARIGQTPFYAYERRALDRRVAELRAALPTTVALHYAVKANPMPAVVDHLSRLVDGFDLASGGELAVALDSGMAPARISFAGPGKTRAELEQAVAAGVLLNVESAREVALLAEISEATGWAARVAVRVNPDFELKSSGMKMGGGAKPFGVDAEELPALLGVIGRLGLTFEGFHLYAGSQNLRSEAIIEAQQKSYALCDRLAAEAPSALRSINLGGGFGIPYFPGEQRLALDAIGENLAELAQRCSREHPEAQIKIELGRHLVGEAGIYVCRILDRKISRGQVFLVTDGGLHHHLAASGNFGQVIRKNYPVAIGTKMDSTEREIATVVGPLCTPLDVLADKMELARAEPGDLVVVFQSGAYGRTASPADFLSHPHPREVLA